MQAHISVIIPTLNEEDYLPKLLESLSKQTMQPAEVIVADAFSDDKTRQIAQSFGCKVVDGNHPGKGGPATARNKGAKVATHAWLLFLDADVILPPDFLYKSLLEMEKRSIDVAGGFALPNTNGLIEKLGGYVMGYYFLALQSFSPRAGGYCIFAKRELHEKIGGFDEEVHMAEDHDYVKRASKVGKFGYLSSSKIFVSTRRFREEGWFKTSFKYFTSELITIFKGKNTKKLFNFEFGKHEKE